MWLFPGPKSRIRQEPSVVVYEVLWCTSYWKVWAKGYFCFCVLTLFVLFCQKNDDQTKFLIDGGIEFDLIICTHCYVNLVQLILYRLVHFNFLRSKKGKLGKQRTIFCLPSSIILGKTKRCWIVLFGIQQLVKLWKLLPKTREFQTF